MAITVNTKTPTAITVSSVGSGNSPYTKERNPHRGGGGGHFAPASTGKFVSNERRLEIENERLREALNADNQTIRLYLGEMTQQEMRAVKAAFTWVLFRAALKEGE
jgi:hypothetical protein